MSELRFNTELEKDKIKNLKKDKNDNKERGQLLNFYSNHPVIGLIGTIVTVIGVILSIYFFIASKERPELICMVNPTKTAVFRNGQTSNLTVLYNGKEIKNDITAVQVAFWNAGKRSIWANSVLEPLIFRTSNKTRIIDINLRKQTRTVTEIKIDKSRLDVGEVKAQWRILEENDGGIIQIIYEGNEDVKIEASATIEGQKELKRIYQGNEDDSDNTRTFLILIFISSVVLGFLLLNLYAYNLTKENKSNQVTFVLSIFAVILILFIAFSVYKLTLAAPSQPPFNF